MRHRTDILLLILPLLPAFAGMASAQTRSEGKIAGVVLEKGSGEAVIGATVVLRSARPSGDSGFVRGAVTNNYGFYSIPGVPPGAYLFTVRSIGHRPLVLPLSVAESGEPVRFDVEVENEKLLTKEVVVEADRDNPIGAISTVTLRTETLDRLPSLGGESDLFRAMQLLPGVKSLNELSSGLYVRGGSSDENLTLLDGAVVYNPSHVGGFLSTFNSDAIRDVKLIKGAFPAEYGGRLSSVVDVTMKEGTKEKISGTAGLSMLSSRLMLEGPVTENATFMVSARRMYLDLILPFVAAADTIPRYYFYDVNVKGNYRISENDHLYLSGYFGRDYLSSPPGEERPFYNDWGNTTANLRWTHIVSPDFFTTTSAILTGYRIRTNFDYYDSTGTNYASYISQSDIRDITLRAEAEFFPHEDHDLKGGVELTPHHVRAESGYEYRDSASDRSPEILTATEISAYARDEWRITPQLSVNAGGRLYWFSSGDYIRLEPRFSVSYAWNDNLVLRGSLSQGYQFMNLVVRNDLPLPTDLWFPASSSLPPGEALQGVLGLETTFLDRQWLLSVEGYYKKLGNLYEYSDSADFSHRTPLQEKFTRGRGEAYGVEFFLNRQFGALTGWIGYTLSWTARQFPELNNGRPFYPRYDRRHDISVVASYRLNDLWEFGATWTYASGQAYTFAGGQYQFYDLDDWSAISYPPRLDYSGRNQYRLPAYHKLDLHATYAFNWLNAAWQLSMNLYNAYNRRNVFSQYIESDTRIDPRTHRAEQSFSVHRISLFPIMPTIGLTCKF